jgi:hypothetical protein
MKPPDPCEPLEKLVDKLTEQLDALCSQSQEHLFLEGLIDLRGLTEATRAMLKDAEGRLANCRRHPVPPPSNRPFLVTFNDSNCSRGIAEAHPAQGRTPFWQRVVAYVGLGVLSLSLGYALHEHRVTQSLAAQNEQEFASLNATRSQIASLTATVTALGARPELTLAPVADTTIDHQTASPPQRTQDRRVRQRQSESDTYGKAIEDTGRYGQLELASMSNTNIPSTTGANQASTNADAQVRLDRDHARLGFQRHYWFWKATIAHEAHRISSLATVPIREASRRQIPAN